MGDLAERLVAGERRALSRAITLAESTRPDHVAQAQAVLAEVLPQTGGAVRVGITGTPGVGKSTFVRALGLALVERGHHLGVLAVDPTSARSGGSILGDKTRMGDLAEHAYVRPSPAAGQLGGVARATRESVLLLEAAGHDVVVVETVGVGQSETAVAGMVDVFCLLVAPAGGDDLQGIKRGIMELADLVVVNKADGDLLAAANRTRADYAGALRLQRPAHRSWTPTATTCSAGTDTGVEDVWAQVLECRGALEAAGELATMRAEQARTWMWAQVRATLLEDLRTDARVTALAADLERQVVAGTLPAGAAATALLAAHRA